jgi:hypothetical protein
MPDQLELAIEDLRESVFADETLSGLAETLLALQKFRSALAELINDTHEAIYRLMDSREADLGPGIGIIRRFRESKASWNNTEMFNELKDKAKAVDGETGEVEIDGFELARLVEKCVAFAYWRKTALRDEKIDFSEHLSEVFGQPRIRFLSKEGS